jgi:hypothetical protein
MLSQCAPLFSAKYRWGFSATMDKPGEAAKIYYWHIGALRVVSEQTAAPIKIYVKEYRAAKRPFGTRHGQVMLSISRDKTRNEILVQLIMRLYSVGRQSLVVGDSVRHIQHLMAACIEAGMKPEDAGQFTGQTHVSSRVKVDGVWKIRWKKIKNTTAQLDHAKDNCQMVFATYGMITEGIDIPRLDAGIDVTPRGSATQLIGRVRRPKPNKPESLWITMKDLNAPLTLNYFKRRLKDYYATGAVVIEGKL